MRLIGYSTGAIALNDFRYALECLKGSQANAVELSALRTAELKPLVAAFDSLDVGMYRYIAIHAPSEFTAEDEPEIVSLLSEASSRGWFVVVHPDTIHNVNLWSSLGSSLCIENMDKRKSTGRTVEELQQFFDRLPKASMCFDIAHARQVDSSMTEAFRILSVFASKIRQVHLSEVSTSSRHSRVSTAAVRDFQEVANLIPATAAIIIEAPVRAHELRRDLLAAVQTLSPPTSANVVGVR